MKLSDIIVKSVKKLVFIAFANYSGRFLRLIVAASSTMFLTSISIIWRGQFKAGDNRSGYSLPFIKSLTLILQLNNVILDFLQLWQVWIKVRVQELSQLQGIKLWLNLFDCIFQICESFLHLNGGFISRRNFFFKSICEWHVYFFIK